MKDDWKFPRRWGWHCYWYGWRRCIWFAFALDFGSKIVYVVLFGYLISYGHMIDD